MLRAVLEVIVVLAHPSSGLVIRTSTAALASSSRPWAHSCPGLSRGLYPPFLARLLPYMGKLWGYTLFIIELGAAQYK